MAPATPHGASVRDWVQPSPAGTQLRQFAGPAEAIQQGELLKTAVSVTAGPVAIRLRRHPAPLSRAHPEPSPP